MNKYFIWFNKLSFSFHYYSIRVFRIPHFDLQSMHLLFFLLVLIVIVFYHSNNVDDISHL